MRWFLLDSILLNLEPISRYFIFPSHKSSNFVKKFLHRKIVVFITASEIVKFVTGRCKFEKENFKT